jgi:hypothetical protein
VTMLAIDSAVSELRALLTGDIENFRRLHAALDGDEQRVFAALLTAAFDNAANDKFGKDAQTADIIEFVSDARAQYVGPDAVNAENAERVIKAALGDEKQVDALDAYASAQARTAMLIAIVRSSLLSDDQIDDLLDTSAQQVRSFFQRQGRR